MYTIRVYQSPSEAIWVRPSPQGLIRDIRGRASVPLPGPPGRAESGWLAAEPMRGAGAVDAIAARQPQVEPRQPQVEPRQPPSPSRASGPWTWTPEGRRASGKS